MKRIGLIIVVLLAFWNVYLTIQVVQLKSGETKSTTIKQSLTEFKTEFTDVVEQTAAKVVGISSKSSYSTLSGSGVIYRADGDGVLILTNNHIVNNYGDVTVYFANGIALEADVLGKDAVSDLALLRVTPAFGVDPFILGNSTLSKVGEWVLAIGNPSGMQYLGSYSVGILSSKDRILRKDTNDDGRYDWDVLLLQSDAALNASSSGGALVNMAGELIGITSVTMSSSNYEGMSFAIPIDEAIIVAEQIYATGSVSRSVMGLSTKDLKDIPLYLRSYYGIKLDIKNGILVTDVIRNGAADDSGIKTGDVIVEVDDQKILSTMSLRQFMYGKKGDDSIEVTYLRNGETLTAKVILQ